MLTLDHLTIVAPSLEAGVEHVREQLGIEMAAGGKHPEMGTHNRLLRLGPSLFLEVIAVDPAAARPAGPRWFGLDDDDAVRRAWDKAHRLRGWVARTDDLPSVLARHGGLLGHDTTVSRGDRSWRFSLLPDGALPVAGVAPSVIDWGPRGSPAAAMPDLGAGLLSFVIEHPDPPWVRDLYERLGVVNPPTVQQAAQRRYRAMIETPGGTKALY
jgi:Glyoxalase-like domain